MELEGVVHDRVIVPVKVGKQMTLGHHFDDLCIDSPDLPTDRATQHGLLSTGEAKAMPVFVG